MVDQTQIAGPVPKWYVIHIQTSYEGRVKQALEQRVKSLGVEDKIFEIVIPTREIIVVKKGKKTKATEKVFPGYILVKMILNDDSWLVVRTTEGVTGFVGAGLKPTSISDKEVEAIDEEKGKIKVLVSIFDRETPVELDFLQVTKL
ncbi:MAG: Transcription antitermination protein nusG [Candidatus Roizmanbacteria bacterium GW2011_GWA2_33_33]|uniref:Transcription antitermination protein nusG n=1 Tax=Candidatus Roizmanbacteria bacterium GW2011_GWA2_33_33 TaxID=1618476 RepID=A0A0G0A5K5_9BACT|nr:MAG: Transcription antitermination protein nusG [Candidatus Roizmanbacteria bacterium GW2011_GWA2_33_33]